MTHYYETIENEPQIVGEVLPETEELEQDLGRKHIIEQVRGKEYISAAGMKYQVGL